MDRRSARGEAVRHAPDRRDAVRRPRQESYDGRFGSSADAGRKRPTGSYRNQPSGSYRSRMGYAADSVRRPSMRDGGDSYTRRPAPKAPPQPRRQKDGGSNALLIILLILAGLVLAGLIALVVSSMGEIYHQMPKVERLTAAAMEVL